MLATMGTSYELGCSPPRHSEHGDGKDELGFGIGLRGRGETRRCSPRSWWMTRFQRWWTDDGELDIGGGGCSRRRSVRTSPVWLLSLDLVVQTTKETLAVLLDNVSRLGKDGGHGNDDFHGGSGSGIGWIDEHERERG